MFEKSVWRKLRNWLVSEYIRLKLWIGEKRSQLSPLKKKNFWFTIIKSRVFRVILVFLLFSCPLTIAFLSSVVHINPLTDVKNYWEEILKVLKYHPAITTIALAIASLPVAFTLWLFRNHDIVMNLDLAKYHEAVRNIHDEKASIGLRQVAFTTLMELKEKWMWEEKIKTVVFPGANLSKLDLDEADLRNANLQEANLYGANLQDAILIDANLKKAELEGEADLKLANLYNANLREAKLNKAKLGFANLERAQLHEAKLMEAKLQGEGTILKRAELDDANLTGAELQQANLTEAKLHRANLTKINLKRANLQNAELDDAFYYSGGYDKNGSFYGDKKPITKKWLEKQEALHVNTVKGIPEE